MRNIIIATIGFMLVAGTAFAHPTIPQAASAMGREMDRQLVERLQQGESPAKGVSLMVTTPVSINDLEEANPLARQMQEELARWFVQAGYPVQEIRKGAELLFDSATGEMLLTRSADRLATDSPNAVAVLVGTYAVSNKNVRFNIRVVQTNSQTVLAMSTMTLPLNGEVMSLLRNTTKAGAGYVSSPIEPTVYTRLP